MQTAEEIIEDRLADMPTWVMSLVLSKLAARPKVKEMKASLARRDADYARRMKERGARLYGA